ncbi:MAG: hypothetical protein WD431_19980 [Cyclobacteriaceae bacterium]
MKTALNIASVLNYLKKEQIGNGKDRKLRFVHLGFKLNPDQFRPNIKLRRNVTIPAE